MQIVFRPLTHLSTSSLCRTYHVPPVSVSRSLMDHSEDLAITSNISKTFNLVLEKRLLNKLPSFPPLSSLPPWLWSIQYSSSRWDHFWHFSYRLWYSLGLRCVSNPPPFYLLMGFQNPLQTLFNFMLVISTLQSTFFPYTYAPDSTWLPLQYST